MAAKVKRKKPIPRAPGAGRPTTDPSGALRSVSIKITPPVYAFLARIGGGIPGRGARILIQRAAEIETISAAKPL